MTSPRPDLRNSDRHREYRCGRGPGDASDPTTAPSQLSKILAVVFGVILLLTGGGLLAASARHVPARIWPPPQGYPSNPSADASPPNFQNPREPGPPTKPNG